MPGVDFSACGTEGAMSLERAFADRYRIVRLLGHGGMAAVYLAHQVGIGGFSKKVALKIVHKHLATQRQFTRYFINEARLGGYLLHPNIVQTLDFGEVDGRVFLAMEYVDGPTVQQLLRQCKNRGERIPVDVALQIVIGVCQALDFAHVAVDHQNEPLNMVHRDLKPSNILVSRFGHVKLGDFGVARAECNLDRTLVAGTLKGTVRYMSPEQAWGVLDLDHRADLFAVGLVLFDLLTLTHLYDAETSEVAVRQAQEAHVGDRLEAIPPSPIREDLIAFLTKTLARSPDDRFQSAGEMVDRLTRLRARLDEPVPIRSWMASRLQGLDPDPSSSRDGSPGAPPKASRSTTLLLQPPPGDNDASAEPAANIAEAPVPGAARRTPSEQHGEVPTETLRLSDAGDEDGVPTTVMALDNASSPRGEQGAQQDGEQGRPPSSGAEETTATEAPDEDAMPTREPDVEATAPGENLEPDVTETNASSSSETRSVEAERITVSVPDAQLTPENASPSAKVPAREPEPSSQSVTVKLPAVAGAQKSDDERAAESPSLDTRRTSRRRRHLALSGVALALVAAVAWFGASHRRAPTRVSTAALTSATTADEGREVVPPEGGPTGHSYGDVTSARETPPGATPPPGHSLPTPTPTHAAGRTSGRKAQGERFGWLNAASLPASSISLDGRPLKDFPVQNLQVSEGDHRLLFQAQDGRRLVIPLHMQAGARIRCWADFNARKLACR